MKYIDEFRDREKAQHLVQQIHQIENHRSLTFMEVCGTHSVAIARYGIQKLLEPNVRLISGPGCPVCVTPLSIIDQAIGLAEQKDVIIMTFGDMLKVPGSKKSLEQSRNAGSDVRVVESCMDALHLAQKEPLKQIVFIGIGFETTAPTVAVSIMNAQKNGASNFSVLCAHKTMPYALECLCKQGVEIDGFLCPGHVSAIIGTKPYQSIVRKFKKACVIAGFEPLDILASVHSLIQQVMSQTYRVENQYNRVVQQDGNQKAQEAIQTVFEPVDSEWRGLGVIPNSGLKIKSEYVDFDAEKKFDLQIQITEEQHGCMCGQVLQGQIKPQQCLLFGKQCTPDSPVGACMVSREGACHAVYRFGRET